MIPLTCAAAAAFFTALVVLTVKVVASYNPPPPTPRRAVLNLSAPEVPRVAEGAWAAPQGPSHPAMPALPGRPGWLGLQLNAAPRLALVPPSDPLAQVAPRHVLAFARLPQRLEPWLPHLRVVLQSRSTGDRFVSTAQQLEGGAEPAPAGAPSFDFTWEERTVAVARALWLDLTAMALPEGTSEYRLFLELGELRTNEAFVLVTRVAEKVEQSTVPTR